MSDRKRIEVDSFDGCWDAGANKCFSRSLSRFVPCWMLGGHEWVHGYSEWSIPKMEPLRVARFCRRCTKVECFHEIADLVIYERRVDKYTWTCQHAGQCVKCGVRLAVYSPWTSYRLPSRATALVAEYAKKYNREHLPSGFWAELPMQIETAWESVGGEVAARRIADAALRDGRVHGYA